jgi:hypothetical protein
LYQWWALEGPGSDSGFPYWDFWLMLCLPEIPSTLWQWQLSMVEAWSDEVRGGDLFRSVVIGTWQGKNQPSLKDLHVWVDQYPRFKDVLEPMLAMDVRSRDPETLELRRSQRTQEESIRTKNRVFLEENLDGIRVGTAIGPLLFLAKRFLRDAKSFERVKSEFGSTVVAAAEEGFGATLHLQGVSCPR